MLLYGLRKVGGPPCRPAHLLERLYRRRPTL